ncbi:MAG: hypothetical protein WDM70_09090 [Nitrosomonadales bacterium]
MIYSGTDFARLKWSLLVFLTILCAGGAAIIAGKNFIARAQQEKRAAQIQLNTARSQFAAASEDLENIKTYTFEYDKLLKRNLIGEDQRLDWIEGLEKIHRQNIVLDFKYSIVPQHPFLSPMPLDSGNYKLNMSDMIMQFDLLHEGQLLNFFDTLRTDVKGVFILDQCAIERSPDPGSSVQLKAECTGGWLTLKNGNAK